MNARPPAWSRRAAVKSLLAAAGAPLVLRSRPERNWTAGL